MALREMTMTLQTIAHKTTHGFTLAELVIVIAILAIMTSVTLPYAVNSHNSRNLKSISTQMAQFIGYGIALSETENIRHRVVINTRTNSYWLERFDPENNEFINIQQHLLAVKKIAEPIKMADFDGFVQNGENYFLEIDPQKNWPNAQITLIGKQQVQKIKVK